MMIRAGEKTEISNSGNWVILDIGFANKTKSCGLKIDKDDPIELKFNEAVQKICEYISNSKNPVNLIIEAPLSVSFDENGNPKGRSIEKQGSKIRYWYVGAGCAVMVAALYLVKAISDLSTKTEVMLFEGFVSFKKSGNKSDHSKDVELLREVVDDPKKFEDKIITKNELKMSESDRLKSAFLIAGIDAGIPVVIKRP